MKDILNTIITNIRNNKEKYIIISIIIIFIIILFLLLYKYYYQKKYHKKEITLKAEITLKVKRIEDNKYYTIITCETYKKFLEEEGNKNWRNLFIPSKDTIMKTKEGWTCNNNKDKPMCLLYYKGAEEFLNWLKNKTKENKVNFQGLDLNGKYQIRLPKENEIKNENKKYVIQKTENTKIASKDIILIIIIEVKQG